MKKLLLISALLLSSNGWAETYSCQNNATSLAFTLSRVQQTDELTQFRYQTKEDQLLYSIVRESDSHIHLVRDYVDSASYFIVGKKDQSYVGVYIQHENSSQVFDGTCFEVNE